MGASVATPTAGEQLVLALSLLIDGTERPWQTAKWLDGPALVRYLRRRPDYRNFLRDDINRKRVERWAAGARADYGTVDAMLVPAGTLLCELPDSLFLTTNGHKREAA